MAVNSRATSAINKLGSSLVPRGKFLAPGRNGNAGLFPTDSMLSRIVFSNIGRPAVEAQNQVEVKTILEESQTTKAEQIAIENNRAAETDPLKPEPGKEKTEKLFMLAGLVGLGIWLANQA